MILPVGISFYTFHGLSYIIDIYNGHIKAEKNFIDYSVFVSFFQLFVAGASAGAMAMSNTMIYKGNAKKAHLKGDVKITTGLGFMDDEIFDSHFKKKVVA